MRLHKIWVKKISLFRQKKCTVNYFQLLPVMFQATSLTCALRCNISVYCINQSLDKHSFLA